MSCRFLLSEIQALLEEAQKKGERDTEGYRHFANDIRQHRKSADAASAKPKGKAKSKAAPAPKTKLPLDLSNIEQRVAKVWLPPDAALWKSRADGQWNSRYLDFPQCSRTWARYGEGESLRLVLKDAWERYLAFNGFERDRCSVEGIF